MVSSPFRSSPPSDADAQADSKPAGRLFFDALRPPMEKDHRFEGEFRHPCARPADGTPVSTAVVAVGYEKS
ncbi:MAG: hypothetical protein CL931_08995 [Deltaproteobacteria bacterium]|nr:hypothetical protein [Deltaproteobacteria bacterium]